MRRAIHRRDCLGRSSRSTKWTPRNRARQEISRPGDLPRSSCDRCTYLVLASKNSRLITPHGIALPLEERKRDHTKHHQTKGDRFGRGCIRRHVKLETASQECVRNRGRFSEQLGWVDKPSTHRGEEIRLAGAVAERDQSRAVIERRKAEGVCRPARPTRYGHCTPHVPVQ